MNPSPTSLALAEKILEILDMPGFLRLKHCKESIAALIDEDKRPLVEAANDLMPHLESDLNAHEPWQEEIEALSAALQNHQPKE